MLKLLKSHCTLKSVFTSDECIVCALVLRVGLCSMVTSRGKQLCNSLVLEENILSHFFFFVFMVEVVNMFHLILLDR